jgi:hypothetical protein
VLRVRFEHRDKNNSGAKLRYSEIGGAHKMPSGLVPEFPQLLAEMVAVILEDSIEDATYVLDHYGLRTDLVHHPDHRRK